MIILDNESTIGTNIVIKEDSISVKAQNEVDKLIQGIGGFTDDKQLIGIYLNEEHLYFLYNHKSYFIDIDNFKVKNKYISENKRNFEVKSLGQVICSITYEAFIDPGILIYGGDVEEFDFLLRFYRMTKDKVSIVNIINYIKRMQQI